MSKFVYDKQNNTCIFDYEECDGKVVIPTSAMKLVAFKGATIVIKNHRKDMVSIGETFVVLLGGPGLFRSSSSTTDIKWDEIVAPLLESAKSDQLAHPNEHVLIFIYAPAYQNRWVDDSKPASDEQHDWNNLKTRNKHAEEIIKTGSTDYLDYLEKQFNQIGIKSSAKIKITKIDSAGEFLQNLKSLNPESISRIWYLGHAEEELWLTLGPEGDRKPTQDAVLKRVDLEQSDIHKNIMLCSKNRASICAEQNNEAWPLNFATNLEVFVESKNTKTPENDKTFPKFVTDQHLHEMDRSSGAIIKRFWTTISSSWPTNFASDDDSIYFFSNVTSSNLDINNPLNRLNAQYTGFDNTKMKKWLARWPDENGISEQVLLSESSLNLNDKLKEVGFELADDQWTAGLLIGPTPDSEKTKEFFLKMMGPRFRHYATHDEELKIEVEERLTDLEEGEVINVTDLAFIALQLSTYHTLKILQDSGRKEFQEPTQSNIFLIASMTAADRDGPEFFTSHLKNITGKPISEVLLAGLVGVFIGARISLKNIGRINFKNTREYFEQKVTKFRARRRSDPNNPTSFTNRFPEHEIDVPKIIQSENINLVRGRFNYVVLENGKLLIGRKFREPGGGHIDLANGKLVIAAGEVKLLQGELKYIDNTSGHYEPFGINAQKAAEKAFRDLGFQIEGKYINKVWVDDPNLPRGGAWRPIQ